MKVHNGNDQYFVQADLLYYAIGEAIQEATAGVL